MPERFAERNKLVLALDLGRSTGFSFTWVIPGVPFNPARNIIGIGQLDLSLGPYDSGPTALLRLNDFLAKTHPDLVFVEDVKYTPPEGMQRLPIAAVMARAALSCEFFGALKAVVCCWCERQHVPCECLPIGTLKKRATGKGNANKEQMIAAVNTMLGDVLDATGYESTGADNCADAFWAMVVGIEQYQQGLT